jgi:hypothetical protein
MFSFTTYNEVYQPVVLIAVQSHCTYRSWLRISCSLLFFLFIPPMTMEQCSETLAHKIQTSGCHPKERLQHIPTCYVILLYSPFPLKWFLPSPFPTPFLYRRIISNRPTTLPAHYGSLHLVIVIILGGKNKQRSSLLCYIFPTRCYVFCRVFTRSPQYSHRGGLVSISN